MGQTFSDNVVDSELFFPAPPPSYDANYPNLRLLTSPLLAMPDVKIPVILVEPGDSTHLAQDGSETNGRVERKSSHEEEKNDNLTSNRNEERISKANVSRNVHSNETAADHQASLATTKTSSSRSGRRGIRLWTKQPSTSTTTVDKPAVDPSFLFSPSTMMMMRSSTQRSTSSSPCRHRSMNVRKLEEFIAAQRCSIEESAEFRRQFIILYFHANACDIGYMAPAFQMISTTLDLRFILVEYPGYGLLREFCTTTVGIDLCGKVAYRYITETLGYPPERVVIFGRSIGCGPASLLASRLKKEGIQIGGLILVSPYSSISELVGDFVPLSGLLIKSHWQPSTCVASLGECIPLCILHGQKDEVIHWWHGERVLNASSAAEPLRVSHFPRTATHNSFRLVDMIACLLKLFHVIHALESTRDEERTRNDEEQSVSLPILYERRGHTVVSGDNATDEDIFGRNKSRRRKYRRRKTAPHINDVTFGLTQKTTQEENSIPTRRTVSLGQKGLTSGGEGVVDEDQRKPGMSLDSRRTDTEGILWPLKSSAPYSLDSSILWSPTSANLHRKLKQEERSLEFIEDDEY